MAIRIRQGITFDDVLLEPRRSGVDRDRINLRSRLTKTVFLDIPILAAAMDTVSESRMAIALGKLGGMAVVHRNCAIADSVRWVREARRAGVQVGAAVGPHDIERAIAISKAGATAIFVDCAHAHHDRIIRDAKKIKKAIRTPLILGNIGTAEAARALMPFADGLKVGIGPGAICTTRIVTGVGVPQLTAIMDVVAVARKRGIPVIADGGMKYSGDVVKALAAGASSVMLGSMLAGTDEAPGKVVTIEGKKYKQFRGMGSLAAMQSGRSSDRYFQKGKKKYVPEGVEAITPYKGPVGDVVWNIVGGLKSGMGYLGAMDIPALTKQARFIQITSASLKESHPHTITIAKKAPNY
ncbi:MAG: IMP dehydrogenase [Candidatus Kerfeldbacteria bacterium]|nr:IMP dehydrogenase [Candidatus Kerfeldbacteria bacterium]